MIVKSQKRKRSFTNSNDCEDVVLELQYNSNNGDYKIQKKGRNLHFLEKFEKSQ